MEQTSDYSMFNDFPELLTVSDLQKVLKIGRNTAYSLVETGEIKSIRIRNSIRILKTSVIDYLHDMCYNNNSNGCASERSTS